MSDRPRDLERTSEAPATPPPYSFVADPVRLRQRFILSLVLGPPLARRPRRPR